VEVEEAFDGLKNLWWPLWSELYVAGHQQLHQRLLLLRHPAGPHRPRDLLRMQQMETVEQTQPELVLVLVRRQTTEGSLHVPVLCSP